MLSLAVASEELAQNGPRPALANREFLVCMAPRARGLCATKYVLEPIRDGAELTPYRAATHHAGPCREVPAELELSWRMTGAMPPRMLKRRRVSGGVAGCGLLLDASY
jgi:hypothetical protein